MTSYIRADKSKEALEADATVMQRVNGEIAMLAKHNTIVTLSAGLIVGINQLILP